MSFSFPRFKAIDGNGDPIKGGLLSTYEEGTSTDKSAFTDVALTVAHANPIVLNSEGEALVYLSGRYKMNLTTAAGAQVPGWPIDNIGDPARGAAAEFYPDAAATDQGVTGDSNTIKYYVDTIGATNKGTIYLRHDGGGEFTDYTFSTSETITSNITLEFEPGARLDIDNAIVVTRQGLFKAGRHHIITGSGTVDFAEGYTSQDLYPEWWGAISDSAAAAGVQGTNVTAFQAALDQQGLVQCAPLAHYRFNAKIRMKAHSILQGGGKTRLEWTHATVGIDFYQSTPANLVEAYVLGASWRAEHWVIRDLALEGANNGHSSQVAGNHAVQIGVNTDAETSVAFGGESIERVIFHNWGDRAVNIVGNAYSTRVHKSRFNQVYDGVWVGTSGTACTGIQVKNNTFDEIGNDCFYQTGGEGPIFTGNVTESEITGFYTHFVSCNETVSHGNRDESIYRAGAKDFSHLWDTVVGGYFRGKGVENVHLDNASTHNDIYINSAAASWSLSGNGNIPVFVYEDTANGAGYNRIRIVAPHTTPFYYLYGSSDAAVTSDVVVNGDTEGRLSYPQNITTGTTNILAGGGYYECDATGGAITLNLPDSSLDPFATYYIKVINAANATTIVPANAGAHDQGIIDGVAANVVLTAVDDYIILRPKAAYAAFGANPFSFYYSRNWESYGKKVTP